MLHSLLTEIVRRHLWPIPLLAVVVAIAAPLLFLQSAPEVTPAAVAPAPAVGDGKLPVRAERLLASTDASAVGNQRRAARPKHDPFAPPKGRAGAVKPAAKATNSPAKPDGTSKGAAAEPVPVVITNADGSVPKPEKTPAPAPSPDPPIGGGGADDDVLTVSTAAVDVRFGKKIGAKLRREIPRLQTFAAGGNIVAVFVKYSPNRDKAVFAISPSTLVTGDVECRRKQGLCRYVDIPAGKHARLTWRTGDGTVVSRRIDVVRIERASSKVSARAARASQNPDRGECLLEALLDLSAQDPPVALSACRQ